MNEDALKNLLFRLADDELIMGHRHSEWTGTAPILEEDIALSSIAQDEIGHAQAYYTLLAGLGAGNPDDLAFTRKADDFRCAQLCELPKGDWASTIARQFFYDAAESVRLAALANSTYKPLAQLARKLIGEEKYHLLHARSWIKHLGHGTIESRLRLQAALDTLYPYALGLFEPTPGEADLATDGILPPESELLNRWRAMIEPMLAEGRVILVEAAPVYGGRLGQHTGHLAKLLDDMQLVYRSDPQAEW
jgi:ring-1,2-phenylacetyl-CoA epoxidase subunit PaaC